MISRHLRPLLGCGLALLLPLPSQAAQPAQRGPFTAADLVRLQRVSDPQVSPDGRLLAYVVRSTDMAANRGRTDLWLVDLAARTPQPRQLTSHEANDSSPRWTPDGRSLYFLSTRSGSSQVWKLALAGGEPSQVTSYPLEVTTFEPSPDGTRLALTMEVFGDCAQLACTQERLKAQEGAAAKGRVFDRVFVRHWDAWSNGSRAHLFSAALGADGRAGEPLDLSRTLDADVPSKPFGGDEEYTFSPDGRRLVFSARVAAREEAWSTNFDLYETAADGGGAPVNLTAANPAWDTQPVFLRDGTLAWLAMERPGFESDRFRIMVRDAQGAARALNAAWDFSVHRLAASWDARALLATVDERGQVPLYRIGADGRATRLVAEAQVTEFASAPGGAVIAWASLDAPADLYRVGEKGAAPARLTQVNAAVLDARGRTEHEQFGFAGWNDEPVQAYVVKPHGFDPARRYPLALIVHGGPQSAFGNAWSWRWNPKTFASAGYAVLFVDFHGTPGYGQAFTDSISRDWGGKPLVDIQKGLAAALERYGWIDGQRVCALGASYGGFMVNWIAGQWPDRFRCLVSHAGIFDARSMYYTTEELWFEEWDQGGPQYENPQNYEQFNPVNHVARWRTPMLVIHGEQDFRVPDNQGIGAFTALQRRGIESRLLFFPDENHWVLKPANSEQWHREVLGWLDAHLQPQAAR